MRLGARGEGSSLFVSDVNPPEVASRADAIGDAVERVAWKSVDIPYSGLAMFQLTARYFLPSALPFRIVR